MQTSSQLNVGESVAHRKFWVACTFYPCLQFELPLSVDTNWDRVVKIEHTQEIRVPYALIMTMGGGGLERAQNIAPLPLLSRRA